MTKNDFSLTVMNGMSLFNIILGLKWRFMCTLVQFTIAMNVILSN